MYTWGQYSNGALGLGDPAKLPAGAPGGYENPPTEDSTTPSFMGGRRGGGGLGGWLRGGFVSPAVRVRQQRSYPTPPDVKEPSLVRFNHVDGKKDKFVFSIAASGVSLRLCAHSIWICY